MQDFDITWLLATDGIHRLAVYTMEPTGDTVRGIVQIVHGMTEHIGRYRAFAAYLAEEGFVVRGHDHVGHGKTAEAVGQDGYFGPGDGRSFLTEDMKLLYTETRERYGAALPYTMLGHSMGSFLLRLYVARYPDAMPDAVIVSGTAGPNPAVWAGLMLARLAVVSYGATAPARLLHRIMFRGYLKRIASPRTEKDWLTRDAEVVSDYLADPDCMFRFTVSALAVLFWLHREANTRRSIEKTPETLPMLFMSGGEDPVGDYGKGVVAAARRYESCGCASLQLRLYPGARHELLQETNRVEVFADVLSFLHNRQNL